MRLKIIYTGNPNETRITNSETGEEVGGIQAVEISLDAFGASAVVVLQDFELDLENVEATAGGSE